MTEQSTQGISIDSDEFSMIRQLTIIGRGECGKTSIMRRFIHNEFSNEISATLIESEDYIFNAEGKRFKLKIWDTTGQDDFLRLRDITIPMSDYVIICYSVADPLSYYEVENTLVPMVKQKANDNLKIMLVGTKTDLRSDQSYDPVNIISMEEGMNTSIKIGAFKFLECSSLKNEGIKEIFNVFKRDMKNSAFPKKTGFFQNLFFCCNDNENKDIII